MNDKPFTLYYMPQLKCINCDNFSFDTGKISDVKFISKGKGITILGWKENNNHYAIFGDNFSIIPMGMTKKIETKNKNIIYLGQKIYSNSQKELFDYIKREVTKRIQSIQKEIVKAQYIKKNLSSILSSEAYDVYIDQMYKAIKTIKTNSKELIVNLKKV